MPHLRLAIASDFHAHGEAKDSPSFLDLRETVDLPTHNPIEGLKRLITERNLQSEVLLCPGDLGHQASSLGIQYVWKELHKVGSQLGASLVTATAGNHDVDSRLKKTIFDPGRILKGLVPPFPLPEPKWDRYWARHYAIVDDPKYRLILLNSSAFHGYSSFEKNHGRIDELGLSQLKQELETTAVRPINILLCHHHPQQHSELGLGADDVMKNGQLLLDLLGCGKYGRWLVIHGHKHHPKITYASGGAASPVVLAAGSFASKLFLPVQTIARNQFYLLNFDLDEIERRGLVGRISSWDWAFGTGWIPAQGHTSLPAEFGFGTRVDPLVLSNRIAQFLATSGPLSWLQLVAQFEEVEFLLPQDFLLLEQQLEVNKIKILRGSFGPETISVTI
jgi:hypothetical protein